MRSLLGQGEAFFKCKTRVKLAWILYRLEWTWSKRIIWCWNITQCTHGNGTASWGQLLPRHGPASSRGIVHWISRHTLPWPSILWHIYPSPLGLKAFLDNTIDLKKNQGKRTPAIVNKHGAATSEKYSYRCDRSSSSLVWIKALRFVVIVVAVLFFFWGEWCTSSPGALAPFWAAPTVLFLFGYTRGWLSSDS